jgi:hypothetical protein
VSVTLVEEEEKSPMTIDIEIDSHDSAQGHEPVATGNPQQPARVEASHITNEGESERRESDGVRSQTVVGSVKQEEGRVTQLFDRTA